MCKHLVIKLFLLYAVPVAAVGGVAAEAVVGLVALAKAVAGVGTVAGISVARISACFHFRSLTC